MSSTLLNSFINSHRFLLEILGFSTKSVMSSTNAESFTFSLTNWMPLMSFSCLIALVRTSNTMLYRSGEYQNPCLVPEFREEAFSFSTLSMMLIYYVI